MHAREIQQFLDIQISQKFPADTKHDVDMFLALCSREESSHSCIKHASHHPVHHTQRTKALAEKSTSIDLSLWADSDYQDEN